MADNQTSPKPPASETSAGKVKKKTVKKSKRKDDGMRETIESVAIAFILAFLFKTFQAEAYVIPTGSMAPTLYGRHKEVACDGCGYEFAVGASSEIDQDSGGLDWRLEHVFCPNCGKHNYAREAAVFNGDRILVNKQIAEYKRFDVVVFKNPEQGHVNYIKRLVGLPNETIRIRKGDIWAKQNGEDVWKIQRKEDPFVQKDIQLIVYDDNHPPRELIKAGWPERWEPSVQTLDSDNVGGWAPAQNAWTSDRENRSYSCADTSGTFQWLRYRHFLPDATTWPDPQQVRPDMPRPEATLIADFCSFNAYEPRYSDWSDPTRPTGIYWTGDLTINASVNISAVAPQAALLMQLVEGPQTFNCDIDLETGTATVTQFSTNGSAEQGTVIATGETQMTGSGEFDLALANVDDRICLWVNDELIQFDSGGEYESSDMPQPGERDLAPCGLALRNADAVCSSLLLQRDLYYRNESIAFSEDLGMTRERERQERSNCEVRKQSELQSLLNNPVAWAQTYESEVIIQLEKYGKFCEYKLAADEYLMFGDNSSMSKDSRLFDYSARPMNGVFSHRYAVREQDLIGKALYIFWPHGVPFLNDGQGIAVRNHVGPERYDPKTYPSIRLPFYPNISRMKKIR